MFLPDFQPIIHALPKDLDYANIYFVHDLHFGSELFNDREWKAMRNKILSDDRAYVCFIGDLMENAVPNSKSDMFTQKYSTAQQKEWVTQQLVDLKHKTLVVVPGNHEHNRTTKLCGLYPLYDCCLIAGIGELYRDTIGFLDIAIGKRAKDAREQVHYFGQVQHHAKDTKLVCSSDYTDGIDFFAYGHDHEPKDRPRAKLVFDTQKKAIYKRNIENINCGSFCEYGGYGSKSAYRPQSDKKYVLRIFSGKKTTESTGFYL